MTKDLTPRAGGAVSIRHSTEAVIAGYIRDLSASASRRPSEPAAQPPPRARR